MRKKPTEAEAYEEFKEKLLEAIEAAEGLRPHIRKGGKQNSWERYKECMYFLRLVYEETFDAKPEK